MRLFLVISLFIVLCFSCKEEAEEQQLENPDRAEELIDMVIEKMGGIDTWNSRRYFSWNTFGARRHVWDSWNNDFYLESYIDEFYAQVNFDTGEGRVVLQGNELTYDDSLQEYLDLSIKMWANDSYWLFLPFKTKDPGVILDYKGQDQTQSNREIEVVEMTFEEGVGLTPHNKYHLFIDTQDSLIVSWSFFKHHEDLASDYSVKMKNYEWYNGLLLSSDRGKFDIGQIHVTDTLEHIVRPLLISRGEKVFL